MPVENNIATIIVTFNRKELLSGAIKSLLAQTYPLKAIFIVDNASTDGAGTEPEYHARNS